MDTKEIIYYHQIKYIDIKHYYIKKKIENGEIKLFYIPTSEITADSLIKSLSTPLFMRSIG